MIPFYEKLYATDGFIAGFPIYTARENGIMATFMDRWDCFSNPYLTRKMPGGKKGLIVCTWMWPNPIAYDHVVETMVILLRLHHVVTTDVLVVSGTRGKKHGKGVVKNHPDILETAYGAGVQFLQGL
jgi:multimeric flavodoxin WrbA